MDIGAVNFICIDYSPSAPGSAIKSSGSTGGTTGIAVPSIAQQPDSSQLSPFAQLMGTLEQLHQSDPTKYQQVTQQIATNLQSAATDPLPPSFSRTPAYRLAGHAGPLAANPNVTPFTATPTFLRAPDQIAQPPGPTAANPLSQLAANFSNASKTGQLPSMHNLAQAIGGGHHHHSHGARADSLMQVLPAFQVSEDTQNPMSIIMNTLSSAGIGGSTG